MHLVVRLTAEYGELEKERTFRIELWDEDGNKILELPENKFRVRPSESGKRGEHHAIIGLQQMVFQAPGAYSFKVYVDDDLKGSIPLELVLRTKPASMEE